MKCLKTGARIFLEEYGSYAICDLYIAHEGTPQEFLVARIAGLQYDKDAAPRHAVINHVDHWFDKGVESACDGKSSTMVSFNYSFFGAEAVAP